MSALSEAPKLGAFLRRDLRIARSYRTGLIGGLLGIVAQLIAFAFVGKLVDPARLPLFGGTRATYVEFVAIGVCLNMAVLMLLNELARVLRAEQVAGTLESLLVTPTRLTTMQLGSTLFSLLYVPLRVCLFLAMISVCFGLRLHAAGILPALVLLLAFLPFVWGLGLLAAGAILTFRRGTGVLGMAITVLGMGSGAFFPISLLPSWLAHAASLNPLARVLTALRTALLSSGGWHAVAPVLVELVPLGLFGVIVGVYSFRYFLRRERRLGTLGLY